MMQQALAAKQAANQPTPPPTSSRAQRRARQRDAAHYEKLAQRAQRRRAIAERLELSEARGKVTP